MKKSYEISLIGLEIGNENMGCVALSYAFLNLLRQVGEELDITMNITAISYDDKTYEGDDVIKSYEVIRVHPKQISFWKRLKDNFKNADIIFDFTLGDSFSDIYGSERYIKTNLLKAAAIKYNSRFILGPQTYGPYTRGWARSWASKIIGKSYKVYSRDEASAVVLEKMGNRDVTVVTDIAFALPYDKKDIQCGDKIKVAINPSGLLWRGGYTGDNQFGLSIDYQDYCKGIVESLLNRGDVEIYLLPHVGTSDGNMENDREACKRLHELYPATHVIDDINSPMLAKDYIAAMDVLVAARMHATVGGVSAGVATIPVAYSRKFKGLFDNIGYEYVLDVKKLSTKEAIDQTLEWISDYKNLQKAAVLAGESASGKLDSFKTDLIKIFKAI